VLSGSSQSLKMLQLVKFVVLRHNVKPPVSEISISSNASTKDLDKHYALASDDIAAQKHHHIAAKLHCMLSKSITS
jgi:hypothetical protein